MLENVDIIIVWLFSAVFLDRKHPEQNVTISDTAVSLSEAGVLTRKQRNIILQSFVAEHKTDGIIPSVKNLSLDEIQSKFISIYIKTFLLSKLGCQSHCHKSGKKMCEVVGKS